MGTLWILTIFFGFNQQVWEYNGDMCCKNMGLSEKMPTSSHAHVTVVV